MRTANAQIIFTLFAADAGLPFARQWADRQIPALITGYTVMAQSDRFWEQTEGRAQGFMTWKHGVRAPISPKTIAYWDSFTKKYGHVPAAYTNFATYDGAYILADAVRRAGSLDSEALVTALEATDYIGVAGRIQVLEAPRPGGRVRLRPVHLRPMAKWRNGHGVAAGDEDGRIAPPALDEVAVDDPMSSRAAGVSMLGDQRWAGRLSSSLSRLSS